MNPAVAAWIGPVMFAITFAETWVSSRERYNERRARTFHSARFSVLSANWTLLFEAILLTDIVLTVAEPLRIAPWVLAGAWLGQLLACERQRRKWRAWVNSPAGAAAKERRNQRRRDARKARKTQSVSEGAP